LILSLVTLESIKYGLLLLIFCINLVAIAWSEVYFWCFGIVFLLVVEKSGLLLTNLLLDSMLVVEKEGLFNWLVKE